MLFEAIARGVESEDGPSGGELLAYMDPRRLAQIMVVLQASDNASPKRNTLRMWQSALTRAVGDSVTRGTPPGPGTALRASPSHIEAYMQEAASPPAHRCRLTGQIVGAEKLHRKCDL